jgi:hypothetical protein
MFKRKPILLVSPIVLLLLTVIVAFIYRPYLKNRFLAAPFGEYALELFDDNGNRIARGTITITIFAQNAMQGYWQLRVLKNDNPKFRDQAGNFMQSAFAGEVHGNEVEINLNLDIADANDVLKGKFESNAMRGEYLFCGFVGCTAFGKFEAVRK